MRQPPEKSRDALRFVRAGKSQTVHQFAGACRRGVSVDGVKTFVDRADLIAVVFVFGFHQIAFELAEFDVAIEHVIERAAIECGDFLAHEGERPVARTFEMSRVGLQFAGDQAEQTGFARAIAPDNADAPAGVEGQIDMFEQEQGAAAEREIIETKHPAILANVETSLAANPR